MGFDILKTPKIETQTALRVLGLIVSLQTHYQSEKLNKLS